MVTVATIPSLHCFSSTLFNPGRDRFRSKAHCGWRTTSPDLPNRRRHTLPRLRVCEMVLPSGKYSIDQDNRQIPWQG